MSGRGPGGGLLGRGMQRKRGWYRTCSVLGYTQLLWCLKKARSFSFSGKTIHFIYWKLRKEKNTSDCLVLANNQWQNGIIWAQKKIIIIIAQPVVLYCVWYSKFHLWYNKLKLMVHNFFFPLIIDMVCLFLGKYIYFTFLQGVSTVSSLFKQSKTYII